MVVLRKPILIQLPFADGRKINNINKKRLSENK